MKKIMFFISLIVAFVLTACGGEKKEEHNDEKTPVSEETKTRFNELKTEWSAIDEMLQNIETSLNEYDEEKQNSIIDSLRTIVNQAKQDIREKGNQILDSLVALSARYKETKPAVENERSTWGTITEDFNSVVTQIEKGDGNEEKIAPRAEGFTEQFNFKKETIATFQKIADAIKEQQRAIKELLTPPAK